MTQAMTFPAFVPESIVFRDQTDAPGHLRHFGHLQIDDDRLLVGARQRFYVLNAANIAAGQTQVDGGGAALYADVGASRLESESCYQSTQLKRQYFCSNHVRLIHRQKYPAGGEDVYFVCSSCFYNYQASVYSKVAIYNAQNLSLLYAPFYVDDSNFQDADYLYMELSAFCSQRPDTPQRSVFFDSSSDRPGADADQLSPPTNSAGFLVAISSGYLPDLTVKRLAQFDQPWPTPSVAAISSRKADTDDESFTTIDRLPIPSVQRTTFFSHGDIIKEPSRVAALFDMGFYFLLFFTELDRISYEHFAVSRIVSRVARICKVDGGITEQQLSNVAAAELRLFSTFLKAELICQGRSPDLMESRAEGSDAFSVVEDVYRMGSRFYGVFQRQGQSGASVTAATALCVFSLDSIEASLFPSPQPRQGVFVVASQSRQHSPAYSSMAHMAAAGNASSNRRFYRLNEHNDDVSAEEFAFYSTCPRTTAESKRWPRRAEPLYLTARSVFSLDFSGNDRFATAASSASGSRQNAASSNSGSSLGGGSTTCVLSGGRFDRIFGYQTAASPSVTNLWLIDSARLRVQQLVVNMNASNWPSEAAKASGAAAAPSTGGSSSMGIAAAVTCVVVGEWHLKSMLVDRLVRGYPDDRIVGVQSALLHQINSVPYLYVGGPSALVQVPLVQCKHYQHSEQWCQLNPLCVWLSDRQPHCVEAAPHIGLSESGIFDASDGVCRDAPPSVNVTVKIPSTVAAPFTLHLRCDHPCLDWLAARRDLPDQQPYARWYMMPSADSGVAQVAKTSLLYPDDSATSTATDADYFNQRIEIPESDNVFLLNGGRDLVAINYWAIGGHGVRGNVDPFGLASGRLSCTGGSGRTSLTKRFRAIFDCDVRCQYEHKLHNWTAAFDEYNRRFSEWQNELRRCPLSVD